MLGKPVDNAFRGATNDVNRLWASYAIARSIEERNKLADAYEQFARMMAAKVYGRRITSEIDFEDYLQYAQIGLIESIERFDPVNGAKFETYAAYRINGAILNGLESATELREQLAARRRFMAERTSSLRSNGKSDDDNVFGQLAEAAIGLAIGFMLEGSGMFQDKEEVVADNSYTGIELRQMRRQLQDTIDLLPERQRYVVHAHYVQNQPFEEIAAFLNLSRGRVSQLHREALAKLGELLKKAQDVDFSF